MRCIASYCVLNHWKCWMCSSQCMCMCSCVIFMSSLLFYSYWLLYHYIHNHCIVYLIVCVMISCFNESRSIDQHQQQMITMLPFETPTIFEQLPRFIFKMPRVVSDQKGKFESDELFRRLSRETEVRALYFILSSLSHYSYLMPN